MLTREHHSSDVSLNGCKRPARQLIGIAIIFLVALDICGSATCRPVKAPTAQSSRMLEAAFKEWGGIAPEILEATGDALKFIDAQPASDRDASRQMAILSCINSIDATAHRIDTFVSDHEFTEFMYDDVFGSELMAKHSHELSYILTQYLSDYAGYSLACKQNPDLRPAEVKLFQFSNRWKAKLSASPSSIRRHRGRGSSKEGDKAQVASWVPNESGDAVSFSA